MAASLNITVVEDHDDLRALTVQLLQAQGHRVTGLPSAEALDQWHDDAGAAGPADLFVVDLNLPGEDGLSLARRLRATWPNAGIVMVTARGQADDRVRGYGHGADLYLAKPVKPDELVAAIGALGRRLRAVAVTNAASASGPSSTSASAPAASPARVSTMGNEVERPPIDIVLDTTALCLIGPGATVDLVPAEAALLEALARAPRRQLGLARIADVLGIELQQLSKASLEVRIVRLRRKLAAAGAEARAIKAVRGFGYQLCVGLRVR